MCQMLPVSKLHQCQLGCIFTAEIYVIIFLVCAINRNVIKTVGIFKCVRNKLPANILRAVFVIFNIHVRNYTNCR